MEFKQVIGRRRSIRFFLPFRPVERSKIQKMLEAARRASCVGNVNNARGNGGNMRGTCGNCANCPVANPAA
jgi:hypothetical protein